MNTYSAEINIVKKAILMLEDEITADMIKLEAKKKHKVKLEGDLINLQILKKKYGDK